MSAGTDHAVACTSGDGPMIVDGVENVLRGSARSPARTSMRAIAGIGLPLADADVLDDVGAAVRQDFVEDLGQEQRIDDVALQLDGFLERVRLSHDDLPCLLASGEASAPR